MSNASTRTPLFLPPLERYSHARWGLAVAIALGAHGALALGLAGQEPTRRPPVIVTELELAPPPTPPTPERPAPEPDSAPAPTRTASSARTVAKAAAPAARAGNLLVAKNDAPTPAHSEPVDFVTDPDGTSYAGGVVARGGTGDHGSHGTGIGTRGTAPVARPAAPRSDITPASDLSRQPNLQGGSGCNGYYPRSADADSAIAMVVVVIGTSGNVQRLTLASESPAGQGFGAAARACLRASRFNPGLDKSGHAVKAATTVRVRFTR